MPNDKSPPKQENVAQQETGGDCVSRLVLCLHCVHWGGHVRAESLAEYPLRSPDEEWRDGVCDKLKRELEIDINAGWEGGSVGYIRTTASFGCAFGEISLDNNPKTQCK